MNLNALLAQHGFEEDCSEPFALYISSCFITSVCLEFLD
jgi:hypothetical protein